MKFHNPVLIVRHGETEWKRQGRTQGQDDSPLTENGIKQVHELANNLSGYCLDLIITSPLGRAMQTSEILATELNIAIIRQSPTLTERHEGLLQGLTRDTQRQKFPYLFDKEGHIIPHANIPEGESLAEFLARVQEGLKEIAIQSTSKRLLVVTHAGVMQAIETFIKHVPFSEIHRRYRFCEILKLHRADLQSERDDS